MKLNINYIEAQNYIATHHHVNVSLTRVTDNEICISVFQKVFIKTIQISLNLRIEEINYNSITLSYDNGIGIDLIISGVLIFIKKKLSDYEDMISLDGTNRIRLFFGKIDKLHSLLRVVDLENIRFSDSSIEIEMKFK